MGGHRILDLIAFTLTSQQILDNELINNNFLKFSRSNKINEGIKREDILTSTATNSKILSGNERSFVSSSKTGFKFSNFSVKHSLQHDWKLPCLDSAIAKTRRKLRLPQLTLNVQENSLYFRTRSCRK